MSTNREINAFVHALQQGDAALVRHLIVTHDAVRHAINAPVGAFGARPAAIARRHIPVIDVLLEFGADLDLKSDWWAGPFGMLEWDITPAEAAPLIARGAHVDIFAAAHLGMLDRVREIIAADPSQVRARGGDGKTALHCATTVAIAQHLLDHGADINARDVDHESTPAQYLVRAAPDVARFLVDRGAWIDIFIAVGLRDVALIERCLRDDPDALTHRAGQGRYTALHRGPAPAPGGAQDHRGDIYRWVFGHNLSAIDVAFTLGVDDVKAVLWKHASPTQQLLAACGAGDRAAADTVLASHPGIVATLTREQMRLVADRAHSGHTAAVLLMLDLGFDANVPGPERFEAIRWAAFLGNATLVRRLLQHHPPLNTPDPTYGGTILGNCLYGSQHGWGKNSGDFVSTVTLLLDAGERVDASFMTGDEALDALLRARLT